MESQNINHIANYLEVFMQDYINHDLIYFKKYLISENTIYKLHFEIGNPLPKQKLKDIDHSEKKYISDQIVKYIEKIITGLNQKRRPLLIKYRYQQYIYEIFLSVKRVFKNETFIHKPEYNKDILRHTINKVFRIIKDAGRGGLSKSEFYMKTRFLKNHVRENIIIHLINQGKIKSEKVGTAKKRQVIYYAV